MVDKNLWNSLKEYSIDDPESIFPFSARLARENGWSKAYAQDVIEEYKKFIYLCMVCDHIVCPSVDVDQAWHLHLTYTKSYWVDLCHKVLKRKLHHNPTKGGKSESNKHIDLYGKTLQSYKKEFEISPPSRIWPHSKVRFSIKARIKQVSTEKYWIVPKPNFSLNLFLLFGLLIVGLVGGCTYLNDKVNQDPFGTLIFVGVVFMVLSFLMSNFSRGQKGKKRDGSGCTHGCGCGTDRDRNNSGNDADSDGIGGGDGGDGCGGGCGGCGGD